MKVVKFLLTDILFDSRDKREVSVLRELGYEVIVLCSGELTETVITEEDVTIYRIKTLGLTLQESRIARMLKIAKHYLYLRKLLKSFKSDCISCHDVTALFIGWSSTWFIRRETRPHLVYDAHEFEAGRNTRRSHLSSLFTISLERFLMKRTIFNIMVNDTIANEVQKRHSLKSRPIVVRNVSPYWKIDKAVCMQRRKELMERMNLDDGQINFLVMYHGSVTNGRGIENLIRAVSKISNVSAVVLGNGDPSYTNSLSNLAKQVLASDRILFHPYVPLEILWQYVGAADVGVVNIENICLSYFYSLPNKFNEIIQSETPVIGSNFPEISRIINEYNIGLTCDPYSVDDLAEKIKEMISNKEKYAIFKTNLKLAKRELCWEKEKHVLMKSYYDFLEKN